MKDRITTNMDHPIPRRKFLKNTWNVIIGIFLIESIAVLVAFIASGTRKKRVTDKKAYKVLGRIEDFGPGSVTAFRMDRLYLICNDDGGMMAVSLQCTHLGCAVSWNKDKEEFECPCHASSFNKMGEVINPPAPRALDVYPLKVEAGLVKVDLNNKMKRKDFKASQLIYG